MQKNFKQLTGTKSLDANTRAKLGRKVACVGAVINSSLALLKIILGYFGRSQALMADGVHSFSDLICDFLVLIAAKYGSADADEDHPYGHYRIETLVTLGLGIILIFMGVGIAVEAVLDIAHGYLEKPAVWTILVAIISIGANEFLYFYTRKIASYLNSSALHANASHARSDSLASMIVLIGLLGALWGWYFLDAIAAIVVALIILKMGLKAAWKSLAELADQGLNLKDIEIFKQIILNTEGVLSMHQLRTRQMGGRIYLDVHILINPYTSASEGHQIAERVHMGLIGTNKDLFDVTIHVDVENHPETQLQDLLLTRSEVQKKLFYLEKLKYFLKPENIIFMDLYYLNQKIEIRLVLKLEILISEKIELKKIKADLNSALLNIPEIRCIRVSFE